MRPCTKTDNGKLEAKYDVGRRALEFTLHLHYESEDNNKLVKSKDYCEYDGIITDHFHVLQYHGYLLNNLNHYYHTALTFFNDWPKTCKSTLRQRVNDIDDLKSSVNSLPVSKGMHPVDQLSISGCTPKPDYTCWFTVQISKCTHKVTLALYMVITVYALLF